MSRIRPPRSPVALVALALLGGAFVGESLADDVRRSLCTRDGRTREVELRAVPGLDRVCDVIDRRLPEGTEERTLHFARDRGFCGARFAARVATLRDEGWRCSDSTEAGERAVAPPPSPVPGTDAPHAVAYRERCRTALASRYDRPAAICECAVAAMAEAGFTERDHEVLGAPYASDSERLPVHAAGLLYGLGMAAIDALESCGTSATVR